MRESKCTRAAVIGGAGTHCLGAISGTVSANWRATVERKQRLRRCLLGPPGVVLVVDGIAESGT